MVHFFFTQRAHLPPVAAALELSPAQCHLLHLIEPGRPMAMGEAAERIACDASNVTGLVSRLESRGLVRREMSASDRRVRVVALTSKGARLREAFLDRMTAPPASFARLTGEDERALIRVLTRLMQ
jgi:DNA-binding MarR family transcriptional regulator